MLSNITTSFAAMNVNQWLNLSAPLQGDELDHCKIFDIDYNVVQSRPLENTTTVTCTSWEFDNSLLQVRH